MSETIFAIDTVVNPLTPEIVASRPSWSGDFHAGTFRNAERVRAGYTREELLAMMDEAAIGRAFLVAAKIGQPGLRGSWHLDPGVVADLVQWRPERFCGLVGLDPTEGMAGVKALKHWVREHGFIGAHGYPHWFELPPDHARWYPFYAACCELGVPIQLQVGQSLVYDPARPLRSVGRPITLDPVACDFPDLKLIGIHIGIPWHDEMIAMTWKHANVFIIADAHAPKHWPASFVRYIDSYGQDKVMFGTDFPVLHFKRMRDEVAALGLRPGPLRKFLRDNALRIYGLKDGAA
jgi:predicted TIM-barrel fold metal-dependent hydrolase